MSYSFLIKADTKNEANLKIEAEFDRVIANQPSHAADKEAASDAAKAFVAVLREPNPVEYIGVSVSGSLSWSDENDFTSASISVSAYVAQKGSVA